MVIVSKIPFLLMTVFFAITLPSLFFNVLLLQSETDLVGNYLCDNGIPARVSQFISGSSLFHAADFNVFNI